MRLALAIWLVLTPWAGLWGAPDLAEQIKLARRDGDKPAEIELLRRWVDGHPGDQVAIQNLTALWLGVADFGMAAETLKAVEEPGFLARANAEILLRRDKNLDGALRVLRERAAAAPDDRDSRLLLSEYLAKGAHDQEQITVLDSLIKEKATAGLYLDRAAARLGSEDPEGALADFRRASAADPDGERVRNQRAPFERLEKALGEIEKTSPADPLRTGYWRLYGGMPRRALADARAGLADLPGSVYGKILETRSLVAVGEIDSAKARAERRVEISAAFESPDTLEGLLASDVALAAQPGDPEAMLDRAAWLCFSGQYLLASDAIESALKAKPSSIPALQLAVAINQRLANLPAATAYAARLTELKAPKAIMADAFGGLAVLAFEQSKFSLALDFIARALAAKPTPDAWKLKADCHTRLGQPNEAADALKNAEKR